MICLVLFIRKLDIICYVYGFVFLKIEFEFIIFRIYIVKLILEIIFWDDFIGRNYFLLILRIKFFVLGLLNINFF